jgi:hypothetical protein
MTVTVVEINKFLYPTYESKAPGSKKLSEHGALLSTASCLGRILFFLGFARC